MPGSVAKEAQVIDGRGFLAYELEKMVQVAWQLGSWKVKPYPTLPPLLILLHLQARKL